MNEYDSGKIADIAKAAAGYEVTDDINEADLVVFNTCSIREKAQEKVFSDLGRVRELKKTKPNLKIAVGGCVASQEGGNIVRRAPYVDVVFGPQTLHRLPELLEKNEKEHRPQVDISFPEIEKFDHLPTPHADAATAFVSIMEGCSKYCSYCVVPYTRGEEFSRPVEDVLVEIAQLAAQGVKEVTLLGQNVNAYRGEGPDGEIVDFALLLEYVAEIDGIERIRFMTSHPKDLSDELIEYLGESKKVCKQMHLPLQSGSDRLLQKMNRHYTKEGYLELVRKIRKAVPDIALSTDIIVGFPGETEEDFAQTMDVVKKVEYDSAFTFIYSKRTGTPAAAMEEQVDEAVVKERFDRLLAKVQEIAAKKAAEDVGKVEEVLVEEINDHDATLVTGRTSKNYLVHFKGDKSLIGSIVDVKLCESKGFYYIGELA